MKLKQTLLSLIMLSLVTACGSSSLTTSGQASTTELNDVLALVNEARQKGLSCGSESFQATTPLSYSATLAKAAQKHSEDMDAAKTMSHTTPVGAKHYKAGSTMVERVTQEGYLYRRLGENVARGQSSAQQVIDAWLNSTGHCKNIMNPDFSEIGLGESGHFWTQVFGTPQ